MATKQEIFYKELEDFFNEGLIREIYSDDTICICNLANQCYGAFCYINSGHGQVGIIHDTDSMRELTELAEGPLLSIFKSCITDKEAAKRIIKMDKDMYNKCKRFKEMNEKRGPSSEIDFAFEEEMMRKNQDPKKNKRKKGFLKILFGR